MDFIYGNTAQIDDDQINSLAPPEKIERNDGNTNQLKTEEAIRQNESRVDIVNKEVVRECKKKVSVITRDQLAESLKISKFVKDFIKTRDDGSPEKIEAVVDWIEDTFQFSNLCEADKRKLLPIVIYFLFKSKYETMLRKMCAYLGVSRRNKKCKEDGQWLYSLGQMKNEVETFK